MGIFLGNGDGTFQAAKVYDVAVGLSSLAVGDFDGDGNLDLAAASDYGGNIAVSVLLGRGDGTFQSPRSYAGPQASSVAVGDLNGDGQLDVALANPFDGTVTILLGNGDGTFQTAQSYATGDSPISVAVGDFNGDGFPDVAVSNGNSPGTVSVLLNAADWGGGPAPAPPGRPSLHPTAHGQPQLALLSVLVAASELQALRSLPLTATDLPPSPVRQWPLGTEIAQPAHAEATFTPTPMLTARHAQDAVFERWGDGVLDVLPMSWVS